LCDPCCGDFRRRGVVVVVVVVVVVDVDEYVEVDRPVIIDEQRHFSPFE